MLIEMENFSIGRSHAKGTALFSPRSRSYLFPINFDNIHPFQLITAPVEMTEEFVHPRNPLPISASCIPYLRLQSSTFSVSFDMRQSKHY